MRAGQIDLLDLELPLVLRPSSPVSDEALMRLSERNKPYRLERDKEGEIVITTPVGGIGSSYENYVASKLCVWTEENENGISFSPNGGFNLPDGACLSPDASWIAPDRWNTLTLKQQTGYPPLCPDFVIEVRSHSDSKRVVEAKMQTWLDNGAQLAWLIDPIDGNFTIYRPGEAPETLVRPEMVRGEGPVAGFELRCTRLWSTR